MAVYTDVDDEALAAFLRQYDIGEAIALKGIAEGVENSNYLLQTTTALYILTLYEKRVLPRDLPFFLGLMDHLSAAGIPCPVPIKGRDGEALRVLCGRPAAIVSFLRGVCPRRIQPSHCGEIGDALARMHLAGEGYPLARDNDLGLDGWRRLADACRGHADGVREGLARMIDQEVEYLGRNWPAALPRGVIHADLFPDNVFFLEGRFSGMIDFYFACVDGLAYDLAICLNAWCFEPDGALNITKARTLTRGYAAVRPFSDAEIEALPILARGAALRFLLTRLYDWEHTPEDAMVTRKDPLEYARKLAFHQGVGRASAYGLDG